MRRIDPDSPIRLQTVVLTAQELEKKTVTVVSAVSTCDEARIGRPPAKRHHDYVAQRSAGIHEAPRSTVAQITYSVIQKYENEPRQTALTRVSLQTGNPGGDRSGSHGAIYRRANDA